jgi:hypothetical protein
MSTVQIPQRVRQVARVLHFFSREELAQLVSLVPELQMVKPAELPGAIEHVRQAVLSLRGGIQPSLNEEFIGGLTYGQYLVLSKEEEDVFWEHIFAEGEIDLADMEEYDVQPDAYVPARQKRGP